MKLRQVLVRHCLASALACSVAARPAAAWPAGPDGSSGALLVEGFEGDRAGLPPSRWRTSDGHRLLPLTPSFVRERERFVVVEENDRRFVRGHAENEAVKIILPTGAGFSWNLGEHPRLAWEWRAVHLPVGAREDIRGRNDAGGALYVSFGQDWLGRLRALKYTYSSGLPVNTVVPFGPLQVVVASSGLGPTGTWLRVERDVVDDYLRAFGRQPPAQPCAIVLWIDSDTTGGVAEVDFDSIVVLPSAGSNL